MVIGIEVASGWWMKLRQGSRPASSLRDPQRSTHSWHYPIGRAGPRPPAQPGPTPPFPACCPVHALHTEGTNPGRGHPSPFQLMAHDFLRGDRHPHHSGHLVCPRKLGPVNPIKRIANHLLWMGQNQGSLLPPGAS